MYLGFDISTQQLKSLIINERREVVHEASVEFDLELPEFRTQKGVIKGEKKTVTAPVLMWIKAVDMVLERLRVIGADFSQVIAISGSAQQHGTVYWCAGAEETLKSLDDGLFLHSQLASCFSLNASPIWQDSSTTHWCRRLEAAVGGPQELARITGSSAFERYSAAQISKIAETKPTAYKNTERISLVSSFLASLFLGRYASIDWSDGSGMNLLDITTKHWSPICLQACAPDLATKLGTPVPSNTVLGKVSNYFVERFGFSEDCSIVAFTGDNPSSLVGMCIKETELAVSLGTSDTLMFWTDRADPLEGGHVLVSPLGSPSFMGLLCYKNGSLTRERIRDSYANGSWEEFNKKLATAPQGNAGYLGLYYDQQEISIPLVGEFRFDSADNTLDKFPSAEIEVRAVVEGQFIAKRAHMEDLGIDIGSYKRIIATGGASSNDAILQVISDIFNSPVYVLNDSRSAALGAAYRAQLAVSPDEDGLLPQVEFTLASKPHSQSEQVYKEMLTRYKTIIKNLLSSSE